MTIYVEIIGIVCLVFPLSALSDDFPYPKDAPADLKDCRNVIFSCDCGNPGYKFHAVIKQCHYWMPPEHGCLRFYRCLECEDGEDRCILCPPGRYGRWCNGVCRCENGGTCNKRDGSCDCPPGYKGDRCEERAVITTGELNCHTKGSDIMDKVEVFINITCPPGCGSYDIWGTSIYSEDSSVCIAAIHSGFVNRDGGSTYIVNNGLYSNFVSSMSNGITSLRRSDVGKSFRFSGRDGLIVPGKKEGCPRGWRDSNGLCLKTAKPEQAWELATCKATF